MNPKWAHVEENQENLLNKGKTVIFTNWLEHGIDKAIEFLLGLTYKNDSSKKAWRSSDQAPQRGNTKQGVFYVYDGRKTERHRNTIVQQFNAASHDSKNTDDHFRLRGKESMNLMKVRTVIMMEHLFSQADEMQVIGRVARHNSHTSINDRSKRRVDVYVVHMGKGKHTQTLDDNMVQIKQDKHFQLNNAYHLLMSAATLTSKSNNVLRLEDVDDPVHFEDLPDLPP